MSSYLDHLDWDKLKSFYVVAINESFTKASLQLNITQSAISRQIGIIEYQLKSQLFIRGSEKLFLTGKGKILFESVSKMIEEAKMAKSLIDEEGHQPKGKLTVATTNSFANVWLIDHLPNFLNAYPEINLSLIAQDNLDTFYERHFDAIIDLTPPTHPHFIHEKIMSCSTGLYASLEYLKEFGEPKTLDDLEHHRLISFGGGIDHPYNMADWFFRAGCAPGKIREAFFDFNSYYGILKLAEKGVGIITIANNNPSIKKRRLLRVLPEINGPDVSNFYNYSKSLEGSKRIKVFGDFLQGIFKDESQ